MLTRTMAAIGWDGVLPLILAATPWLAGAIFPNDHAVEIAVVVLLPIVAALARCMIGYEQIVRLCGGRAPAGRQVLLAAAIVLLLLFEASCAAMAFAGNAPISGWLWPLAFYSFYLVVISVCLREPKPARGSVIAPLGRGTEQKR